MEASDQPVTSCTDHDSSLGIKGAIYLAHLPQPHNTRIPLIGIPYCSTAKYDGGSFLDYPNRVDWPQAIPSPGRPSFLEYEWGCLSDDRKLEDFLQTWLFFGLLHELFGSRYDESRYVRRDTCPATVHTQNLSEDVDIWCNEVMHLSLDQGHKLYSHFASCFTLAEDALYVAQPSLHPNFNRAVRQSIALLYDAMSKVLEDTLPQPDGCRIPSTFGINYDDKTSLSMMEINNWCPSDAGMTREASAASSLYFLERMTKPDLGRDHKQCGEHQCQWLTTDTRTYSSRHVSDHCNCQAISIEIESLASVLDRGATPLLRLTLEEDLTVSVTVESSGSGKAYVALSHVWIDGLGNQKNNSLPACQFRRLSSLMKRLHGWLPWNSDKPDLRELLLWCDTLCVPIEDPKKPQQNRLRASALRGMRDVYQQSSYVLVLDRTLEYYNLSEIGPTEAAFRIMTSPWSKRLWTYQEAVLPDNLLFQFADKAIDIMHIWQYHLDLKKEHVLFTSTAIQIIAWCAWIRHPFHSEHRQNGELKLDMILHSLRGRHVSFPADEPICLATIFGIDTSQIQGTQQRRMGEFWRGLTKTTTSISRTIVLNRFPRLQTPGLRWAPSTLLMSSAISASIREISLDGGIKQGKLSEAGLLVDLAAFRMCRARCVLDEALDQTRPGPSWLHSARLRDTTGVWYSVSASAVHEDINQEDVFDLIASREDEMIVLLRDQLGAESNPYQRSTGLMTRPVEKSLENRTLHSLAILSLGSLAENNNTVYEVAYRIVMSIDDGESSVQVKNQHSLRDSNGETSLGSVTQVTPAQDFESELGIQCTRALEQDPVLFQLMQSMGDRPRDLLIALAHRILFGRYLVVSEKFEADQMWCVD